MNVELTKYDEHVMNLDVAATATVGARLRAAREQQGLSLEEVAERLKLRINLLQRIEKDDYHGMTHAVYLRGYLLSYARLLGLPASLADEVKASGVEEQPLVSTGTISRSRYLLDRYSVSATYLILTALLVGPAVWLATHGGLEQKFAHTELLDNATMTVPASTAASTASNPADSETGVVEARSPLVPAAPEHTPIVASMAPFVTAPAVAPVEAPVLPVETGEHVLTLKLTQASWVEISSSTGDKLEYGLLPAGSVQSYRSDGAMSIRLGNAEGAEIVADGAVVDIAPFRRANVASLKLFGADPVVGSGNE